MSDKEIRGVKEELKLKPEIGIYVSGNVGGGCTGMVGHSKADG